MMAIAIEFASSASLAQLVPGVRGTSSAKPPGRKKVSGLIFFPRACVVEEDPRGR
jgi:hypothetical protein